MITTKSIRERFIGFFKALGHSHVPSASLIPKNDPSIMFVNSGMAPLKEYFTGRLIPPSPILVGAQKCVRAGGKHNDLENVGYTTRHHTFFEMLGNFSFGGYFKEDAIKYAWDFLTKELAIDKDRLYVTIYHTDDDAYQYWRKIANLPDSRIIRVSSDDNFWSMADTGPCGPSSEIFYDYGDEYQGSITEDGVVGDRYVEIWNLVFMQYDKQVDSTRKELPFKCIDTGIGLERLAAVMQGKRSNFEIDIFSKIIDVLQSKIIGSQSHYGTSLNVISDHLRAIIFLMSDGLVPGSNGRRYVLRRIIRRAILYCYYASKKVRISKCLDEIFQVILDEYSGFYEIKNLDLIKGVITSEEEGFYKNVDRGLVLFDKHTTSMNKGDVVGGGFIFMLHDTYGFSYDLVKHKAEEKGLLLDEGGFEEKMLSQKDRSRKSESRGSDGISLDISSHDIMKLSDTVFVRSDECSSSVLMILKAENHDNGVILKKIEKVTEHEECILILKETPFYLEGGGQISDKSGTLKAYTKDGAAIGSCNLTGVKLLHVKDDVRNCNIKLHLHFVKLVSGGFHENCSVASKIDSIFRKRVASNHSATHVLQGALIRHFGDGIEQRGSFVSDEKLRFDFSCSSNIDSDATLAIENAVNEIIGKSIVVVTKEFDSYQEAKSSYNNLIAIFEDVYGTKDKIRVVRIGDSIELCGGTHVSDTSQISFFKILKVSSIAAGVKRVEAVTGHKAVEYLEDESNAKNEKLKELTHENKELKAYCKKLHKDIIDRSCSIYTITLVPTISPAEKFSQNKKLSSNEASIFALSEVEFRVSNYIGAGRISAKEIEEMIYERRKKDKRAGDSNFLVVDVCRFNNEMLLSLSRQVNHFPSALELLIAMLSKMYELEGKENGTQHVLSDSEDIKDLISNGISYASNSFGKVNIENLLIKGVKNKLAISLGRVIHDLCSSDVSDRAKSKADSKYSLLMQVISHDMEMIIDSHGPVL